MLSPIPGANVLIEGPAGTGKTHCLRTMMDAGIETFAIFTEQGMESIIDDKRLHFTYVKPFAPSFEDMIFSAKQINTMSNDMLQKLSGIKNESHVQFIELLSCMHNFIDQHGEAFGDISTWGTDRALVLDGLTGIGLMSMTLAVGSKPIRTQPDWGVAMDNELKLLEKLSYDTHCFFILLAHIEPELDAVSGTTKNMTSALGRKNSPKIPPLFSDVILAVREGSDFYWDTSDTRTDLKTRNLPIAGKQTPSFVPLVKKWVDKGGIIETEDKPTQPQNITPQDTPVLQQAAVQKTETENKA